MKFAPMLSLLTVAVSATAFAGAPQQSTTHPTATTQPGSTTTTQSTVKMTHAEKAAEKKRIEADEKAALAHCKKLTGTEKKTCDDNAKATRKTAEAHLSTQ